LQQNSSLIHDRAIKARGMQEARYKEQPGIYCNVQISSKTLKEAPGHLKRPAVLTALATLAF